MKIIKNNEDYLRAMEELEVLMETDPEADTPEGNKLELLAFLIETYEKKNFPLDLPDPIEAIKFRMEQQGLTNKDLIPYIGSRSKVSEVLSRKRYLTLSMIKSLNKELGIPAEVLLHQSKRSDIQTASNLDWVKFPVGELVKRRWLHNFEGSPKQAKEKVGELLPELLKHLGKNVQPSLYRRNTRAGSHMDEYALMAWNAKVCEMAHQWPLSTTYKKGIVNKEFVRELAKLSSFQEGPKLAQEFLNRNGIYFFVLPHLPKTHLDGAAIKLSNGCPLIALTLRYDRLDNFWFTLFHELGHVSLHLKDENSTFFFDDLDCQSNNSLEEEADRFAQDALIPRKTWEKTYSFTGRKIEAVNQLATELGISPSIVAGRFRRENNNYKILSQAIGSKQVRRLFKISY